MDNLSNKKAVSDKFTQIYNQYKSSIYKFCLVKLNGDSENAEDCMQNTFTVFYRKLKNNEEILNPRAYLYKIANNFVLKCIEANAKDNSKIVPIDDYTDKIVDEHESIDDNLDYQILNEKLNKILTEDEKQLLKYKYIYELTIEEAAAKMEISQAAAAKRLQRMREKIKNSISIE